MFILSKFRDVLRLKPNNFDYDRLNALKFEIHKKFANKVVHKVGLCICLFDIESVGDSQIYPSDGAAHIQTVFRMVVFRPFVGELLRGTIRSCSRDEGIHVSLGNFFGDVLLEPDSLKSGVTFNEAKQLWVWQYEDDEGTEHQLGYDIGEEILVKVQEEVFTDVAPLSHLHQESSSSASRVPYLIKVRANEDGLGMAAWWDL
eukprot:m.24187 g.24187  ORF g.24187 m.24187 type:complete len:202 (+) comp8566_c0_seq1:1004-1609(+)